jgi:hypothetical protein
MKLKKEMNQIASHVYQDLTALDLGILNLLGCVIKVITALEGRQAQHQVISPANMVSPWR